MNSACRSALLPGALTLAAALLSGCSDPATSPEKGSSVRPTLAASSGPTDKHIFSFKGSVSADFASKVEAKGGKVEKVYKEIDVAVTKGLSDADAAAIGGNADVMRDVPRRMVPTLEEAQGSVLALPDAVVPEFTAKSPLTAFFLPQQWNMHIIQAPQAWAAGRTGDPTVRVAILDTGLDPDHIDQNGTVIDVASSTAFAPSVAGPPIWADDHFHGTHVGGIVTTNNIGTAGVAPNVTLIAVKVLDFTGFGTDAQVIAGIIHATDVGAQVINMSLGEYGPKNDGSPPTHTAFNRAINYAHRHGVLVVSSAGNSDIDLQHDKNNIALPCEAGVQMCISATNPADGKAFYSNYGTNAINVGAPGGDVSAPPASFVLSPCSSRSVMPGLAACKTRDRYLFVIGTSQAAPHVSGLGALLDSQYGGDLNASQLITRIQQGADDIGKPGTDPFFGKGRINVFTTLSRAPTP
jgi:lantibiotic leader peptide-processing serine protease